MDAKELRIGNHVRAKSPEFDTFQEPVQVNSFYLEMFTQSPKKVHMEPIPLTEDHLIKFGFKRFQKDFSKPGLILHTRKRGFVVRKSIPIITHVHQLQNLYFAL